MNDIETVIKAIVIDKLGVEASEVKDNSSFIDDLGADELDVFKLFMEISKKCNVEIPDDAESFISTVGDVIAFVKRAK